MGWRLRLCRSGPRLDREPLRRLVLRFGRHVRDQRRELLLAALCVLGFAAMEILRPWPLKLVFDGLLVPAEDPGAVVSFLLGLVPDERLLLAVAAGALLAIAVVQGAFGYGRAVLAARVGHRLVARIRNQLFAHVQRLSASFHDERELGDLLSRLTGDVLLMRELLVNAATTAAGMVVVLLGVTAAMFLVDPWLALAALSTLPLLWLSVERYGGEIRSAAKKQRRREGALAQAATEKIAGIRLVQAFAREAEETERFRQRNRSSARAGLRATRLEAAFERRVQVLVALGTCLVLGVGVLRVRAGALTPGDLLLFVAWMKSLQRPIRKLSALTGRVAKAVASGERILSVLEIEPEVRDRPDAVDAPPLRGAIRFERVTFRYRPHLPPVLRDFELEIRPGECVALTGPSGVGKSTVADLLLRFYEPEAGRITIDGTDIRSWRLESLRRQVAVVMQECVLFAATVRENIAYGRPEADDAEIEAAARAAGAHGFIERLPDGYDTILGEGGGTLSGGQRQRLAIARAILRDSPIVVLDEPLTGLDRETAEGIVGAIARLLHGRTCLLIAHDETALTLADRVFGMRDGRAVPRARARSPELPA